MNVTINKGSLVRIWHPHKGIDYVVAGENPLTREVYLLKFNSLNNDGSVHKSTRKFHKKLPYTTIGNKRIIKGVTAINKRKVDIVDSELYRICEGSIRVLGDNKNFVASITPISSSS